MQPKRIFRFVLVLSAVIFRCATVAADPTNQHGDARLYFDDYLAKCDANEIRCLWFLNDDPVVGMVMIVNLNKETVFTTRDVPNWAQQNSKTRELSHAQKLNLEEIIDHLPAPEKDAEYNKSVFISIRLDGKVKIFSYNRHDAPRSMRRIYDIGGGYF